MLIDRELLACSVAALVLAMQAVIAMSGRPALFFFPPRHVRIEALDILAAAACLGLLFERLLPSFRSAAASLCLAAGGVRSSASAGRWSVASSDRRDDDCALPAWGASRVDTAIDRRLQQI